MEKELKYPFNRTMYDKRKLPPLYFTEDFTVKNSVLYLKNEEYDPYLWNYSRMVDMVNKGILTNNIKQ